MDLIFGAKPVVRTEKSFLPSDLLKYVESLLRDAKLREVRAIGRSNYDWLKSKAVNRQSYDIVLDEVTTLAHKMTPESCTAIAVKLENLMEENRASLNDIMKMLDKLLQEQDNMQMIDRNVRRAKEMKKGKTNEIFPELLPPRQAMVSFIVDSEIL